MKISEAIDNNKALYVKHWSETPLSVTRKDTREEQLTTPGSWVKSVEKERVGGLPKFVGRLKSFSQQEVIVIGHPNSNRFVWKGTELDYRELWRLD